MNGPMFVRGAAMLMAAILCHGGIAAAPKSRLLSEADQHLIVEAVLAYPHANTAEEPSCKSELSGPSVTVSQALASAVVRAATSKHSMRINLDCLQREGYPLRTGQEYCRLGFSRASNPKDFGFGILFLMDWKGKNVVDGSVECF